MATPKTAKSSTKKSATAKTISASANGNCKVVAFCRHESVVFVPTALARHVLSLYPESRIKRISALGTDDASDETTRVWATVARCASIWRAPMVRGDLCFTPPVPMTLVMTVDPIARRPCCSCGTVRIGFPFIPVPSMWERCAKVAT